MASIGALITDLSTAVGLLTASQAIDVVGVFNQDSLTQVFANGRPLECLVKMTSRPLEHPIETGVIIPDDRIILANEIEMPLLINGLFVNQVYNEIKNLWLSATLLSVQTRTDVYQNMYIVNMPHKETAQVYDAVTLTLQLKQAQFANSTTEYAPPAATSTQIKDAPSVQNTVNNGQISLGPPGDGINTPLINVINAN